MELKPYQKKVINDLEQYLEYIKECNHFGDAFNKFWVDKIGTYNPITGEGMELYKNNVPKAPNVCIKVPTAGGKTFIACNAMKTIFDTFAMNKTKLVIWLVPWNSILEQTVKNLNDTNHPYRQKINTHFNSKVQVYTKDELLHGVGFNSTIVNEQLNIFVLSFDTLRSRKKEDRKIYQENGNLSSFSNIGESNNSILEGTDETALINVIRNLNPLVIVDESHNAETDLSLEMLKNLNPCFVLDLTATPKKNSNIISFVNAFELKKESMVKLPVIVYNHQTKTEVLLSTLQLQKKLELLAKEEEKKTGKYIRPIVLFQAQPKTNQDNTTFEKLKQKLIELKIPEEQIKIKTANINELKDIDLLSKKCPVRYIITVNALKEGWDCPFAYILASLADKNSVVDVEQILGRVLRQPHVQKHSDPLLNLSYVLTASSKFMETLQKIVEGLNKAGFSSKDYKVSEKIILEDENKTENPIQQMLFETIQKIDTIQNNLIDTNIIQEIDDFSDIQIENINIDNIEENLTVNTIISDIEETAIKQNQEYESKALEISSNPKNNIFIEEVGVKVKPINAKEIFIDSAIKINLPQFFLDTPSMEIFGNENLLLSKDNLLKDFKLGQSDTSIKFEDISSDLYRVDLEKSKSDDYTPSFTKLDYKVSSQILDYLLTKPKESQIRELTGRIKNLIGDLKPISDNEIEKYIKRIVEDLSSEQLNDLIHNEYTYIHKIKHKIKILSEEYAEKQFSNLLDIDKIKIQENYKIPTIQISGDLYEYGIPKSLFTKEHKMNDFEKRVINDIANLENIKFWWKNPEKKGFKINGFINHYPDFIVVTKSEKILIIESKGDDRDNTDTMLKIKLGRTWANKAGNNYKYFMVFDKNQMEGAYTLNNALSLIKEI